MKIFIFLFLIILFAVSLVMADTIVYSGPYNSRKALIDDFVIYPNQIDYESTIMDVGTVPRYPDSDDWIINDPITNMGESDWDPSTPGEIGSATSDEIEGVTAIEEGQEYIAFHNGSNEWKIVPADSLEDTVIEFNTFYPEEIDNHTKETREENTMISTLFSWLGPFTFWAVYSAIGLVVGTFLTRYFTPKVLYFAKHKDNEEGYAPLSLIEIIAPILFIVCWPVFVFGFAVIYTIKYALSGIFVSFKAILVFLDARIPKFKIVKDED